MGMRVFWILWFFWILYLLYWTNRGFIRSGKAMVKYKLAIRDLNLWVDRHPEICPCNNANGREIKQNAIDAFAEFIKVPQATADPGYLKYLQNFHITGCGNLK